MKSSKGVYRLAVLLGSIGAVAWIIFLTIATEFFRNFSGHWFIVGGILLVSFFIPFLIVHAIAWVVRGFREDKKTV
jgi:hypothetical protein